MTFAWRDKCLTVPASHSALAAAAEPRSRQAAPDLVDTCPVDIAAEWMSDSEWHRTAQ